MRPFTGKHWVHEKLYENESSRTLFQVNNWQNQWDSVQLKRWKGSCNNEVWVLLPFKIASSDKSQSYEQGRMQTTSNCSWLKKGKKKEEPWPTDNILITHTDFSALKDSELSISTFVVSKKYYSNAHKAILANYAFHRNGVKLLFKFQDHKMRFTIFMPFFLNYGPSAFAIGGFK